MCEVLRTYFLFLGWYPQNEMFFRWKKWLYWEPCENTFIKESDSYTQSCSISSTCWPVRLCSYTLKVIVCGELESFHADLQTAGWWWIILKRQSSVHSNLKSIAPLPLHLFTFHQLNMTVIHLYTFSMDSCQASFNYLDLTSFWLIFASLHYINLCTWILIQPQGLTHFIESD